MIYRLSVGGPKIKRCRNENAQMDRTKKENIRGELDVTPIEDKIGQAHQTQFGHVQKRTTNLPVRKIDCGGTGTSRERESLRNLDRNSQE